MIVGQILFLNHGNKKSDGRSDGRQLLSCSLLRRKMVVNITRQCAQGHRTYEVGTLHRNNKFKFAFSDKGQTVSKIWTLRCQLGSKIYNCCLLGKRGLWSKFQVSSSNSVQDMDNIIFWRPSWTWRGYHLESKIYQFCLCDINRLCAKFQVCSLNSLQDTDNEIFWWPSWNWRPHSLGSKMCQFCF